MNFPLLMMMAITAAQPLVVATPTLSGAGAARTVQEAQTRLLAAHAPSAIAVVDDAGQLLLFVRMDGVRPGSIELAIGKAHSAALMRRPTAELEDNVTKGRVALATAGLTALRGGVPIIVAGVCVGAVGVAGLSKEMDDSVAKEVATVIADASRPPA